MTHVRKQIRDAAKAALTGLTTTGSNAFQSRVHAIHENTLPAVNVYTANEESELVSITSSGSRLARTLELVVEAYVKKVSGYDDQIDQIAVEVEEALNSDATLSGLTKWLVPAGVEIEFEGEGEKPVAVATMTFNCLYETIDSDPETAT